MSWVRLWHDMPTDPKWRVIARKSGQPIPNVLAVFSFLMIAASQNGERRGLAEHFDSEDVAAALDLLPEDVEAIVHAMQGKVLEGMRLTGWEKRQPKREDNSAERVKAYRERKRTQGDAPGQGETQPDAVKRTVTQRNAPDTDADSDSDADSDADSDVDAERMEPKGSCATVAAPALKPEHFAESWNALAKRLGMPCIRDLTPERRQKLKARIAGYSIDDFRAVLAGVERSAFLRGETGWHGCTFDWVTKKANFQKILEGNYDG